MPNPVQRQVGEKSRIDGVLHRTLPADLHIRTVEDGAPDDGLLRLRISCSSETPVLRCSWWDDDWLEVLGHTDKECDLSRLNNGGAVLGNHNRYTAIGNTPLAAIGVVERAWLEGGRLMADICFSRREALSDLRQDILDGIVSQVSIGYSINERVLTKTSQDGPDEYRVTSWQPFEISPVDIAADPTVGIGRSADLVKPAGDAQPGYRVIPFAAQRAAQTENPTGPAGNTQERQMPDPVNPAPAATQTTDIRTQPDPLQAERDRVREITELGRQHSLRDLADAAVASGQSADLFRSALLEKLRPAARVTPTEGDSDIGMSGRDLQRFSFTRALLCAMDPMNPNLREAAAFELECSRAAQDKRKDSVRKDREAAVTIPADVLRANFSVGEDAAQSAQRMLSANPAYRDLTVGTATAGGNLVATNLLASSFIELLRARMFLNRAGATVLSGLDGFVAIPRQTGGAAFYWVGENGAVTESQATFDQVTMSPKTIGVFTDYSRRLLLQSSLDVEAFVRADIALSLAVGMDWTGLNGTGASNTPTGLFNTAGIGAVIGGTNGAAPAWDHIVQLEEQVATANADIGALAYVSNPKVRSKLKRTQKFSGTNGQEIWQKGRASDIGELNGYDAYATNQVPSNLTKGTSTSVCSAIGFGNWADVFVGMWGGLDLLLDPYTGGAAGTKRVVALQDTDIALRRPTSFAAMLDALTA